MANQPKYRNEREEKSSELARNFNDPTYVALNRIVPNSLKVSGTDPVSKEVITNQRIYKYATDNGLNIADARNQLLYGNDALTTAAANATSNKKNNSPTAQANYSLNYSPTYGNGSGYYKQTDQFGDFSFQSAPVFYDQYGDQVAAQRDKILNRWEFSYNPEDDEMYQILRAQYNREGDRAMRNTLGEMAARTGGLASSYAGSAATQANQYYAQQLADKIPELQQLAYSMYMDDLNNDRADLAMLQDASDRSYAKYRDTVGDWYKDRDFTYGVHRDDVGDEQWQTTYDRGVLESDRSFEETQRMNNISIDQWNQSSATEKAAMFLQAGITPDASLLETAGIPADAAQTLASQIQSDRAFDRQQAMASRSGGGSGGMSMSDLKWMYENGIKTPESIELFEQNGMITKETAAKWKEEIGYSDSATGGGALTWDDVKEAFGGKEIDMGSIATAINGATNPDSLLQAYEAGEVDVVVEGNTVRVVKKNNEPRNRGQNGLHFGYNGHR